jgi:cell division protein FtsQ
VSRWIVIGVLAATTIVAAAIYVLRVTSIEVVGTSALSPNDVLAASGLRGGERILWMRTGGIASHIERFPSVSAVDVQRKLPGTIVIRVTERAAAVVLGHGLAADVNGVVFQYPRSTRIPELVGWRGPARPGALLDGGSRAVLQSLRDFPSELRRRVRRITLIGSVTMVLDDGTEVRFGQPDDLVAKARAAAAVLQSAAEHHHVFAYIDVRAPTVPAARDRIPPTPQPSPGASTRPPGASTRPSASP